MGIKTSMYLESIRCSSQHICCHFLLKDAKRSWLRTYKLRCTTLLAQPIWLLPSLNTAWNSSGPLLIASEKKWWNHIFSPYALRKAINHLPYLLSKADLDSVMILLHEKRVSTASNRSNWKLIYQVPSVAWMVPVVLVLSLIKGTPKVIRQDSTIGELTLHVMIWNIGAYQLL